jgi:hypothetical protein
MAHKGPRTYSSKYVDWKTGKRAKLPTLKVTCRLKILQPTSPLVKLAEF